MNARSALYRPLVKVVPAVATVVPVSPQIAVNTAVSRDELIDFVSARHHAIVITARADGRPQTSPVTCGVDAEGRIVVATYPERAKARNARRNQQVSVVVLSDDFGGPWVQVDGTAEVLDVPEAVEPLVEYFRSISGEHPDWEEYRQAMVRQGKSLLRVTPVSWGPVATGGFPPRLELWRRQYWPSWSRGAFHCRAAG